MISTITSRDRVIVFSQAPTHGNPPEYVRLAEKRAEAARKALDSYIDLVIAGGATPWDGTLDTLKAVTLEAEETLTDAKRVWGEELHNI